MNEGPKWLSSSPGIANSPPQVIIKQFPGSRLCNCVGSYLRAPPTATADLTPIHSVVAPVVVLAAVPPPLVVVPAPALVEQRCSNALGLSQIALKGPTTLEATEKYHTRVVILFRKTKDLTSPTIGTSRQVGL